MYECMVLECLNGLQLDVFRNTLDALREHQCGAIGCFGEPQDVFF